MVKINNKDQLKWFVQKLVEDEDLTLSTAQDYAKRILRICEMENVSLETFNERFDQIFALYTTGEKKEIGKSSHNAYRSALAKYKKYVSSYVSLSSSSTAASGGKYTIDVSKICPGVALLVLKDENGNIIDKKPFTKNHNSSEDIARAAWELLFEVVEIRKKHGWVDIFKSVNCGLIVGGKVAI